MPNDTDVSIIKPFDYQILNFAFVDNAYDYHSVTDTPENLNTGSLQHMGNQALSSVKYFLNLEVFEPRDLDKTYFNIASGVVVQYSQIAAQVIGALVILFSLFVVVNGFATKIISPKGVLLSIIAIGVLILLYSLFGKYLFTNIENGLDRPKNLNYHYHRLLIAAGMLSIGVFAAYYQFIRRWIRQADLVASAWILWALLSCFVLIKIPNASYAFIWPLLFLLVGQLLTWKRENGIWPMTTAGLLTWYIWSLLLYMTALALALRVPEIMAPVFILILSQMMFALLNIPRRLYISLIAIGIGVIVFTGLNTNYSERKPRPTEVFYWHDADNNENYWTSHGENKDAWAQDFFNNKESITNLNIGIRARQVKIHPAPDYSVEKSEITMQSSEQQDNKYVYKFIVSPKARVNMGSLQVESSVGIDKAWVDNKELNLENKSINKRQSLALSYFGFGKDAFTIAIETSKASNFSLALSEVQGHWPQGFTVKARPKDIAPSAWEFSDSTVITQTVKF
jgi:hypothetical protein